MARASFYAGIAIGNAGTNIVHALAYPLQGQHRVTHGVANSLLLPYGMEFNALSNLCKFAAVAEALGEPIAGLSPRAAAAKSAEACRLLSLDVGIPQRMREVGIKTGAPRRPGGGGDEDDAPLGQQPPAGEHRGRPRHPGEGAVRPDGGTLSVNVQCIAVTTPHDRGYPALAFLLAMTQGPGRTRLWSPSGETELP